MLLGGRGRNDDVLQHVDAAAEALKELRKLTLDSPHRTQASAVQLIELDLEAISRDHITCNLLEMMKKAIKTVHPIMFCSVCTEFQKHITIILEATLAIMREINRPQAAS